jgi:hypothetical protein
VVAAVLVEAAAEVLAPAVVMEAELVVKVAAAAVEAVAVVFSPAVVVKVGVTAPPAAAETETVQARAMDIAVVAVAVGAHRGATEIGVEELPVEKLLRSTDTLLLGQVETHLGFMDQYHEIRSV